MAAQQSDIDAWRHACDLPEQLLYQLPDPRQPMPRRLPRQMVTPRCRLLRRALWLAGSGSLPVALGALHALLQHPARLLLVLAMQMLQAPQAVQVWTWLALPWQRLPALRPLLRQQAGAQLLGAAEECL